MLWRWSRHFNRPSEPFDAFWAGVFRVVQKLPSVFKELRHRNNEWLTATDAVENRMVIHLEPPLLVPRSVFGTSGNRGRCKSSLPAGQAAGKKQDVHVSGKRHSYFLLHVRRFQCVAFHAAHPRQNVDEDRKSVV